MVFELIVKERQNKTYRQQIIFVESDIDEYTCAYSPHAVIDDLITIVQENEDKLSEPFIWDPDKDCTIDFVYFMTKPKWLNEDQIIVDDFLNIK